MVVSWFHSRFFWDIFSLGIYSPLDIERSTRTKRQIALAPKKQKEQSLIPTEGHAARRARNQAKVIANEIIPAASKRSLDNVVSRLCLRYHKYCREWDTLHAVRAPNLQSARQSETSMPINKSPKSNRIPNSRVNVYRRPVKNAKKRNQVLNDNVTVQPSKAQIKSVKYVLSWTKRSLLLSK